MKPGYDREVSKLKFEYRVRNRQGQISKGTLEADNKNILVESFLNQGYYVLSVNEARQSSKDIHISYPFQFVSVRDLVIFTRQLATMIAAGLSIIRCLDILQKQTANKKLKKIVTEIRTDIESGLALWEAVNKHAGIFSKVYISMVKAGELGGMLEPVLLRLSDYLEREQEISSKVKTAAIYPIIISIFAILVAFFIITFILPNFVDILRSAGGSLPLPTRILLITGTFIRKMWLYLISGIVLLVLVLKWWGKTAAGRLFYDYLYLHLPMVGKTISRITVARFARTMGILLKAGIPILQALEVVEMVVGNRVIERALNRACTTIREGQSINGPLEESGVFEPMVTQMIAVGEEIGCLDEMLIHISDYFEREVIYMIDSLTAIIEPLLILMVAFIVGGVVIATLLPILEIINMVGV